MATTARPIPEATRPFVVTFRPPAPYVGVPLPTAIYQVHTPDEGQAKALATFAARRDLPGWTLLSCVNTWYVPPKADPQPAANRRSITA
jgi:hypothetical protein